MSSDDQSQARAREFCRKARRLRIDVLRPVRTHLAGAYQSAFHGPGMAFEELRHYEPGDDVRHIAWHVLARFGVPFVKRFVEERELRLLLVMDVSGSMDFGSGPRTKRDAALEAAATLALSAARGGDRVGAMLFGAGGVQTVRPARGERHALRVLRAALALRSDDAQTDVRPALRALGNLRSHSIAVLLSDVQFEPPLWDDGVRRLLAREAQRHELVAVTVRDPAERTRAPEVILECRDAESGRAARLDLHGASGRRLRDELDERARRTEAVLKSLGIGRVALDAGEDVILPLREFFRRRQAGAR